ncbi:hypothetical protein P154DRAFT_581513 [Amniculicola lignicola CBS 123094]|uniref:Uncharacterized protein n=1 Tax=Amniculicola lignicola CBS 123094 TaxID=1392246 RepID=A0A6A5W1G0_9PLEO|nr:hypothetical protein P154DRAFT_581513 [Amniculicola lignicola CBS 123094]
MAEDEADRKAVAEFERARTYYNHIKRKDGYLSEKLQRDWDSIQSAEVGRKKKRVTAPTGLQKNRESWVDAEEDPLFAEEELEMIDLTLPRTSKPSGLKPLWNIRDDRFLMLKLIDTHGISVNTAKIANAWHTSKASARKTSAQKTSPQKPPASESSVPKPPLKRSFAAAEGVPAATTNPGNDKRPSLGPKFYAEITKRIDAEKDRNIHWRSVGYMKIQVHQLEGALKTEKLAHKKTKEGCDGMKEDFKTLHNLFVHQTTEVLKENPDAQKEVLGTLRQTFGGHFNGVMAATISFIALLDFFGKYLLDGKRVANI